MRRQEEADGDEERNKRRKKDTPSRSTLSVPDVRLRDDVDDSDEDTSSEENKGDPEKHKHVQSDAHNSIGRVASKTSVVDRLKVLLATSEEEGCCLICKQ
jgi:hypothetical protein